jgi:hypothetical protein
VSSISSVSIMSDYKLEDRGSIPGRDEGFFSYSLSVQTSSEGHPMGTRGPFPGGKASRERDADPISCRDQE